MECHVTDTDILTYLPSLAFGTFSRAENTRGKKSLIEATNLF
jgi:hypothetical protein